MDTTLGTRSDEQPGRAVTDAWLSEHFDHMAPQVGEALYETLERMRSGCPVAHSDQYGGFWTVTGYEDVLRVLQDWETFSNAEGVSIPMALSDPPLPPDEFDPPLHRAYRKLINTHLTPSVIACYEEPTRRLADELVDAFIEDGRCEWMATFAHQFPRLAFFENVLHAPADDIDQLNEWVDIVTAQRESDIYPETNRKLVAWIEEFASSRKAQPPRGDVVDAVLDAKINGRPISRDEMVGTLQLLMFGGFETTSSALGHIMVHLAADPALLRKLSQEMQTIPTAIEELLRIDSPVVAMARTVVRDVEVGGQSLRRGDKVLFSLSSANRDESEFEDPAELSLSRAKNRHLAFGAGVHRCAGSSLARMNLRVALEQMVSRLHDIQIQDSQAIEYQTTFTRTPLAVPITFTPGPRAFAR